MPKIIERLYNQKEEAKRLGFSVRKLQAWRRMGIGPPFFKIHGAIRYDPARSDAWLQEQISKSEN